MLPIKKTLSQIWQAWTQFWFAPVSLVNLAVFRLVFCGTMFVLYLSRQVDVTLYFTDKGILPKAMSSEVLMEFFRSPIQLTFWNDSLVPWMHGLLVLSFLLLCLGIGGRAIAWLALLLEISFLQRNYAVAFGVDQIGVIFTFYLAMTQSCERLSLTQLWKKNQKEISSDIFTSTFYRLIQIQLCVIYAFSGFEKLKGSTWWDGTALWTVFANSQMVVADFTWMRQLPWLISIITFSTVIFEIYFTPLVWNANTRKYILGMGVLFHIGIAFTMALYSFAVIMIAPYVLFLPETKTKEITQRVLTFFKLDRYLHI